MNISLIARHETCLRGQSHNHNFKKTFQIFKNVFFPDPPTPRTPPIIIIFTLYTKSRHLFIHLNWNFSKNYETRRIKSLLSGCRAGKSNHFMMKNKKKRRKLNEKIVKFKTLLPNRKTTRHLMKNMLFFRDRRRKFSRIVSGEKKCWRWNFYCSQNHWNL